MKDTAKAYAIEYWGNDNPPLELIAAIQHAIWSERSHILEWLNAQPLHDAGAAGFRSFAVGAIQSEVHTAWSELA